MPDLNEEMYQGNELMFAFRNEDRHGVKARIRAKKNEHFQRS